MEKNRFYKYEQPGSPTAIIDLNEIVFISYIDFSRSIKILFKSGVEKELCIALGYDPYLIEGHFKDLYTQWAMLHRHKKKLPNE